MNESQGAAEWIYTTLKANSTLTGAVGGSATARIFEDVAPQGVALPYVVFQRVSGVDVNTIGERGITDQLWQVKAVAQSPTYRSVATIANQFDVSLDDKQGTAGGVAINCRRSSEIRYAEIADGMQYRHLGGTYHLFAAGTA